MEPVEGGYVSKEYFYKNSGDENVIDIFHSLFENLPSDDRVIANIVEKGFKNGISHETMVGINNHLSSSECWEKIIDWTVSVEYTIEHPSGDIVISDNEHEKNAKSMRRNDVVTWSSNVSPGDDKLLYIRRVSSKTMEKLQYNSKRYTNVKISRSKEFVYQTKRSSLVFKLEIYWEGESKESAGSSIPTYTFQLETLDSSRVSKDTKYSSVSFIEKCLDIVSLGKESRCGLVFN